MSHGVKKSTFIEADEKTTKALTYDMLSNLYDKLDELIICQKTQANLCDERFKSLESRKRKDATIASAGGIFGGFVAVVAYYIKQWLS
jgi:hypothetical protein